MSDFGRAPSRHGTALLSQSAKRGLTERRALTDPIQPPSKTSLSLKLASTIAVAGLIIYIACQALSDRTITRLLSLDATNTAEDRAARLMQQVPDLETALAGRQLTTAETASLERLQADNTSETVRFFDRTGAPWQKNATETTGALPAQRDLARSAFASGKTVLTGATRYDQPDNFATAYTPLRGAKGQPFAVLEVGMDQTRRYREYSAVASALTVTVGLIAALAFAVPAIYAGILAARTSRHNQHLATYEALTDRGQFNDAISLALKHAEDGAKAGVVMIGPANYGSIVERHGEAVGEELLKQFAVRLRSNVRHGDMVARLRNEHFGIIQRLIRSSDDCDAMINRLRAILQEPYDVRGTTLAIELQVAVALLPGQAIGPSAVVNALEISLKQTHIEPAAAITSVATA